MSKNIFSITHKPRENFIKERVPPKKNSLPLGFKASKKPRKDRNKSQKIH